ncbi:MAG TPA: hypothetical protein PLS03_18375 [Terrimicrobiaceae bacterium]|nr:hypothetical protein [Terrimicrobiaceae bacterium]
MKWFSLRSVLVLAVLLALAANIGWRIFSPAEDFADDSAVDPGLAAMAGPEGENIMPSFSNLSAMADQWKRRMDRMAPAERQKAEDRLREEAVFFIQSQSLPPAERKEAIRQRLEALMNDPGIQAEWAEERFAMMTKLPPTKRQQLFKRYVQYKTQTAPR